MRAGGVSVNRSAARRRGAAEASSAQGAAARQGGEAGAAQGVSSHTAVRALSAFAGAGYQPSAALLDALAGCLPAQAGALPGAALAQLLVALAVLQRPQRSLLAPAMQHLQHSLGLAPPGTPGNGGGASSPKPTCRQAVDMLWALCALGQYSRPVCGRLAGAAFSLPAGELVCRPLLLRRLLECRQLLSLDARQVWRPLSGKWLALRSGGLPSRLRAREAAAAAGVGEQQLQLLRSGSRQLTQVLRQPELGLAGAAVAWHVLGNGDAACLVSWQQAGGARTTVGVALLLDHHLSVNSRQQLAAAVVARRLLEGQGLCCATLATPAAAWAAAMTPQDLAERAAALGHALAQLAERASGA